MSIQTLGILDCVCAIHPNDLNNYEEVGVCKEGYKSKKDVTHI